MPAELEKMEAKAMLRHVSDSYGIMEVLNAVKNCKTDIKATLVDDIKNFFKICLGKNY